MKISVYGANWESAEGWHPASDRLSSKPDRADCQSAAGCQPAPQKPLLLSYGAETTYTQTVTEMFATYPQVGPGLQYADQRWYNPQVGKFFLSPDPGGVSTAKPKNPTSWNRFLYANGDPVNFLDPRGGIVISAEQCAEDPDECLNEDWNSVYGTGGTFGGSGGGGSDTGTDTDSNAEPYDCSSGYTNAQTSLVENNYVDVLYVSSSFVSQATPANAGGLTADFLSWSAQESGWAVSLDFQDDHNYFGMHRGWTGSIPCGPGVSTLLSCFPKSDSLSDELNLALAAKSGKTGQTYASAVSLTLYENPSANMATVLQSIADNGWKSSNKSYGSSIAAGVGQTVTSLIGCLQSLGRLP